MDRILTRRFAVGLPLREILTLVSAIVVILTMVVVSEGARDGSVGHERMQLLAERVRADSSELGLLAGFGSDEASAHQTRVRVVALAEGLFRDLNATLAQLRGLAAGPDTGLVDADLVRLARIGVRVGIQSGPAPRPLGGAEPALDSAAARLTRDADLIARAQAGAARTALGRADSIYVGSLLTGLATLLVLGMRLLAMHRRTLAAEHERLAQERTRALVENLSDVITVVGPDLVIRWQSGSVSKALGRDPSAYVGLDMLEQAHPDDRASIEASVRAVIAGGTWGPPITFTARARHSTGEWRHVEVVAENRLGDPAIDGIVLSARDVSERTRLEAELRHQAFHDKLTGLANRALFEDHLRHATATARRIGRPVGVLFCDLDDFKTINDSLGHAAGDELLREVAIRIASTVRGADTAARIGGDEFAVLLHPADGGLDADVVAERLLAALARPVEVAGRSLRVSASLGVATSDGTTGVDELLRNADTAMYAAKGQGKNTLQAFDATMHERAVERLETTAELEGAVARGEFELDLQPIVALTAGGISGVEALVRWAHPTRGRLVPGEFIALAEETGLIVELGDWVLREACAHAGRWQAEYPERMLRIGVNVSPRQLEDETLPERVAAALREGGLSPERLVIEITESVLPADTDLTISQLSRLKALGVNVALDDFGTGYSSLARLHRYPIDIIKIDRSFIAQLDDDDATAQLVEGIIHLSDSLRLDVVAEGIETEAQARALAAMRVSHAQGFLFSRPVAVAEVDEMLADGRGESLASDQIAA